MVDLTVEDGNKLKIIYATCVGFHGIDLDNATLFDIYIPAQFREQARNPIYPQAIIILPDSNGKHLLLCYDNEGVYLDTEGHAFKNIVLQWGEIPSSIACIANGQLMGWGNKAIELRSLQTGQLDGVFMHKKAQKLKFLCERNDKVFFSVARNGSSQVYFMSLNRFA